MSRASGAAGTRSSWKTEAPSGANSIRARLRQLYGEVEWPSERGIVHVAAIDAESGRVLIPGPFAPKSPCDRFVLGFARARCDAILTTGAILRSEPDLRHDPGPSPAENAALLDWRREMLGRSTAPRLIVLSGSGEFPLDHPAVVAARAGTILTTEAGAQRLPERVGALEVRIGLETEAPIAGGIRVARQAKDMSTLAIEAGPSATAPLYASRAGVGASDSTVCCDELLLSRFEGSVDPRALGPSFFDVAAIERLFMKPVSTARIVDASGEWRFDRYRRASSAAPPPA